ncbi:tetratricopeptide repeat protein [Xanthobacter autotrophicus]|uniref:tetratricopeptide repeat protein n=1 Tax=Xanthobacter autotrophicus TaxID=280 RepID=UPI0024A68645|nr:tetratricopeptide repeat protein [Xanthobacter autotrophicus]MDI4658060.1 tetratricopeptide repeat protein [Xanthobacter autotrophicus]
MHVRSVLSAVLAGLLAACVIWLVGAMREASRSSSIAVAANAELASGGIGALTPHAPEGYVGSVACAGCHATEGKAWLASQHSGAMSLPTEATVKGRFDGAQVGNGPASARFFRDGTSYRVEIAGSDGKPSVYSIAYTFGLYPLQQYLVAMPDGRVQALPFAYDTRPTSEGGQRWFHLYGNDAPMPGDPLFWTGPQQNWNHMCAECHSTALRKTYDAAQDRFDTHFSEISVGCESCHGAGASHVAWASGARDPATPHAGFASAAALRPPADWTPAPNSGSPAQGVARPAGDGVETCARCHARRGAFSENWQPGQALTQTHMPVLLDEGLFTADGQNQDEVFNDHAFKQSLMYRRGVSCTDCHDPHTAALKAPGAAVCGQCHLPERFASQSHTGHAPGPGAPDCIGCHMPRGTYMVVDARHDHSFRIPRPDLSVRLGTPNACSDCHADKSAGWAAAAVERWHGPERKGFQTWGPALHDARMGAAEARAALVRLAQDGDAPGLVRATAVSELAQFPARASDEAMRHALADPDPMVRVAALRAQAGLPRDERWRRAAPLLADPSTAVRLEAAELLADMPIEQLAEPERGRFLSALAEYEAAQRLNADRPDARANLGIFLLRRGDATGAEAEFRAGLRLDPTFAPLRVNLADLYRSEGREGQSEAVLREGLAIRPDASLHHALGLALVRQRRYDEALGELAKARALAPAQARYAYVEVIALQSLGRRSEAMELAEQGLERNPNDPALIGLVLNEALAAGNITRARQLVSRLSALQPDNAEVSRLAARLGRR